jgi:hypothetical protein
MTKVVIDMTMSLDGFVAGPGDGKDFPLGKNDGVRISRPACSATASGFSVILAVSGASRENLGR